ncbi:hypothetical protein GCK32_004215 [Trichostrongylus colubriformis]|uniref:Uncharacterized protein n=1 Tax=Trichostrongylus colubriformis TaxID=6319 RepID=A0AAN8FTN0_TRICO
MSSKSKHPAAKGPQYKHERARSDHVLESRRRLDESDIYDRYSAPYGNNEHQDRHEKSHRQQFREDRSPYEASESVENPRGMHVARIEIANEPEQPWDHPKVEHTTPTRIRNHPDSERRGSPQQNSKPSKIPPPPCMKNFEIIDGYTSNSTANQQRQPEGYKSISSDNQQRQPESEKRSAVKQRSRDNLQYNSDSPKERSRHPESSKTSGSPNEHQSPTREQLNRMVVFNMTKAPKSATQRPSEVRSPAHRKVSTNPFLTVPEKKHHVDHNVPQPIKNVQEVVQKMNSGEWPIKINEEIVEVKIEVPPAQKNRIQSEQVVEKARNWETLRRNSPQNERRDTRGSREPPQSQHTERTAKEEEKKMQKRRKHKDADDSSDRSDIGELTTVSTDSAFGSEAFPVHSYRIGSQLALQHQQNIRELEFEAEKLLLYFKGHRLLLNYLGIGLTETLWRRMSPLPLCEMEIRPVEHLVPNENVKDIRQYSDRMDSEPKVVVMQVPNIDVNRQHPASNKAERMERPLPAQSPRLVALERQLRTDDMNYDWEESSRGYSSDGEGDRRDSRRMDSRSGRFVKKSAAALIAKKQGFSSQHCLEQPSSSEIVDPRIASEIRALREREEELRRSRTELGLPTLDDVMNRAQLTFSQSGKNAIFNESSLMCLYQIFKYVVAVQKLFTKL